MRVVTIDKAYELLAKEYHSMDKDTLVEIILELTIGSSNSDVNLTNSLTSELNDLLGEEYRVVEDSKASNILFNDKKD
jgi:hypothetical protein